MVILIIQGKTAEPAAKAVAQKHGMQTLGKVLPARRPGQAPTIKPDTLGTDQNSPPASDPNSNPNSTRPEHLGEAQSQSGWTNSQQLPSAGPPRVPSVPIPALQPMQVRRIKIISN